MKSVLGQTKEIKDTTLGRRQLVEFYEYYSKLFSKEGDLFALRKHSLKIIQTLKAIKQNEDASY